MTPARMRGEDAERQVTPMTDSTPKKAVRKRQVQAILAGETITPKQKAAYEKRATKTAIRRLERLEALWNEGAWAVLDYECTSDDEFEALVKDLERLRP
jgi:hypothetical protein